MPPSSVCRKRVAKVRLAAYVNGRARAIPAMPRRRAQRSEKLCEFHVKKPTGRIAPSSSSEPSTLQKTGASVPATGKALLELDLECAMAGVELATARPSRKMSRTLAMSNDDSHPQAKPIWNGFSARLRPNATECVPRLKLAACCLGNCKSSILSKFSQDAPGAD